MTIRNFYFVAAYGVWIYIILCFLAKLLLDRCKRAAVKKRIQQIQQFFAPSQAGTKHPVKFSKILKYTKEDNSLFVCACESYNKAMDSYSQTEKHQFARYMNVVFSEKSHNARPQDVMENCLIAIMEALCDISESQTGAILAKSAQNAEMAEFWGSHGSNDNASSVKKGGETIRVG